MELEDLPTLTEDYPDLSIILGTINKNMSSKLAYVWPVTSDVFKILFPSSNFLVIPPLKPHCVGGTSKFTNVLHSHLYLLSTLLLFF